MDGGGELLHDFIAALDGDPANIVIRYPPDRPMNYTELKTFVCAHLPKNGPYVLLAESFSGPIAISIAASGPPGLAGLILSSSFARNPRRALSVLRPFLSIIPLKLVPTRLLGLFALGRFATPIHRQKLSKALAAVSLSALRTRARSVLDADVTPILRHVSVPVLYLRATKDRIVPSDCGETIVRATPRARVVEIEAPHFLLQVAPKQAAAAIKEFIAALPSFAS